MSVHEKDATVETAGSRCEIAGLYFWLGEEAERVGFTPWQTAWVAVPTTMPDKPASHTTDPLHMLSHQMAWAGIELDGRARVGCTCGWAGSMPEFHEHTGIRPWTDDEIREALENGRL